MYKVIKNYPLVWLIIGFVLITLACGSSSEVQTQSEETPEIQDQLIVTNTTVPTNTLGPINTPEPTKTHEPTNTPKPTNTPRPSPTPILGLVKIGTYLVGQDIEPGIYWGMAGDDMLSSCYWARLSNLSGDLDSIIANDNGVGQYYVEIIDTDFAFETVCELILLEYAPISEPGSEIAIGTYIVGRDIQPGLYKGQAGEDILYSCYWARLMDLSGEFSSLIANDNATGSFYVEVLASDFALTTQCPLERVED